jgi:hypothetical protein
LSKPNCADVLGGYAYDWEDEKIKIEVRRLNLRFGDVNGEIIISTTSPGVTASHLHQARFNFSDSPSRDKLAKSLSLKLEAPWSSILEQVSVYTLERFRRGEPVVHLSTHDAEIKPPEYLLRPFIIKNYPTILFGDPSGAKSLTAQVFSALLYLPWYDNPLGLSVPSSSKRVLYLDWETDEATIKWSLSCLSRGMDIGILDVAYRRCNVPLSHDLDRIQQYIGEEKADLTIFDSLGLAAGGDLNSSLSALDFWTAWRSLHTTSLILAHVAKNGEDKKRSTYGSQYFTAEARSIWEIKKSQEPDSSEMDVAMFNRKPPPFSRLHGPIGIHFDFEGDGEVSDKIIIRSSQPESVEEFVKGMGTQKQIEVLLKRGPMDNRQIMEELDISDGNVRIATKRLKDKGRIIKAQGEKWGLAINV